MTRPLATGSSSSTINHSPLTVGNSRTISATKSSAHWRLVGTTRTLLLVYSFSLLSPQLTTCERVRNVAIADGRVATTASDSGWLSLS